MVNENILKLMSNYRKLKQLYKPLDRRIGFSLQASSTTIISDIKNAINAEFSHIELKWDNFTSQGDKNNLITNLFNINWHGISLSIHTPLRKINIGSPMELERKKSLKSVMDAIQVAVGLKAEFIVYHAGKIPAGSPKDKKAKDKALHAQQQSINEIVSFCQEKRIVGALENGYTLTDIGLVTTIGDMANIAESVEGVTFLLDIGHFILNTPLRNIRKQLNNYPHLPFTAIHLHDNRRTRDEHLSLGEGVLMEEKVELKAILESLNTCPIIIECRSLAAALKTRNSLLSLLHS